MFTFFCKKIAQLSNFIKGTKIGKKLFNGKKRANLRRFFQNPLFYFGLFSFIGLFFLFSGADGLAKLSYSQNSEAVFLTPLFERSDNIDNDLFFGRNKLFAPETPDLKIIQDNFIYGISTPRVFTTQTLGAVLGDPFRQEQREVVEYSVQPGDTIESIAQNFKISLNTLLWANNLSRISTLKVGQILTILPVSGVVHIVKTEDTISEISKTYKVKTEDVVAFNDLTGELDIFIGDILIVPDGVMPAKPLPSSAPAALADSFFIYPAEGQITQRIHWYNAVDVANKCGTPVYAAAPGVVQRTRYGWNFGGGNLVTILHSSGIVTYYGHLMTIFVKPGNRVDVGTKIGLIGGGVGMEGAGISTGCHLHFGVTGAKNPLSGYLKGAFIKYR